MKKQHVLPTSQETKMPDNGFIVSKTDAKGMITYCNEIFTEMSGYEERQLLGKNQNIIRHPDMPKVAFKLCWDLISSGKEFFGFVKNMSKNGGYYWVFANITPDYDSNEKIVGYTSVRRKPPQSAINTIEPIYKRLVDEEKKGGMKASGDFLAKFLQDKNISYDELVLSLQGE